MHAKQHHTPHAGELKTPFRDAQHPRMFHRRDAAHDAVSRAISTAQLLSPLDASARPCGIAVASPVRATTTTNAHAHGYARGRGELRSPLAMIDANSPQGKNTKRTNASSSMPAPRGGFEMRVRAASKLQRKPSVGAKSRLARSRSASEESLIDDANGVTATVNDAPPDTPTPSFRAVESFDEMVNRLRLTSVMDDYATRELALVYEESLEARSLRAVLENVKDSELEMAHVEAERRDKWAKSIEENIERKWASKVREMEKENAKLRVEAHSKDVALDRAKT